MDGFLQCRSTEDVAKTLELTTIGSPVGVASSTLSPFNSATTNIDESRKHIIEVAPELRTIAQKVFEYMQTAVEDNLFLNVPNLMQWLVLMASVGHTTPSKQLQEMLLHMQGVDQDALGNREMSSHVATRACRDLTAWQLHIRDQCLFSEYQTRRRLFVNHLAARSYSFRTFQALNSLLIEIKINAGQQELNGWAMGMEQNFSPGGKIFKIWEYDEEKKKDEAMEGRKDKIEQKPSLASKPLAKIEKLKKTKAAAAPKEAKVPSGHKCPILMSATQFEIPVHPFVLDMRTAYTMGSGPAGAMRAVRFMNDSTQLLRYFRIGKEHRGCRIPCRLKDENTGLELMIFWSGAPVKRNYNVLTLVETVIRLSCGQDPKEPYDGPVTEAAISELHMPLWEQSNEAVNIAQAISKRISDHLFAEGGFGDLANMHDVRPTADSDGVGPPSFQAFDMLKIRTPVDETAEPTNLDGKHEPEKKDAGPVARVSLPYYLVVYDDSVKCPVYLGRVAKPSLMKNTLEEEECKWNCSLM